MQSSSHFLGFPGGTVVKNLPAIAEDARDMSSIPGSGRSPWGGKSHGQRSLATVHRVAKSQTFLSMHALLVKYSFCLLISFLSSLNCQVFLYIAWISPWQLFWILYKVNHSILCLWVQLLKNGHFIFGILYYHDFIILFDEMCLCTSSFEIMNAFLI